MRLVNAVPRDAMTPDAATLDQAFAAGQVRRGRLNSRPVHCARCHAACLPGQAQAVYLATWAGRRVYLCLGACLPKRGNP